MPTPADAISRYIHAKDGNRPYLMRGAFAQSVRLEMIVKTDAIAFPPSAEGLDLLTDILVRRFARDFENVYTFCLASPAARDARQFSCDWLVGMSGKDDGSVRVGCGRYDWYFQKSAPGLVEKLKITIERMRIFSPACHDPVMAWLSDLSYPWCPLEEAIRGMPDLDGLAELTDYISRPSK